jgi:hypothetical protein
MLKKPPLREVDGARPSTIIELAFFPCSYAARGYDLPKTTLAVKLAVNRF